MKPVKKKFLSFIMTLAIILCMIPMSVPVMAKENLPGISQNTPIYTYTYKSSGKVYRYTNSSLTTKESGHWIDCATDLCRIIEIQNNAVKVIYPTSSGNKTGWFFRSEFCKGDLKGDQAKYSFKATKNITTYRWKENNTTAGAIYNGDKVYLLRGDQNSSWLQVLYPVSGGYKMAWVKGDDLFANSIKLNKTSISKQGLGWTETLTATLSPSNSADSVTWSSSNTGVATVSGSGVVKAVGYGTATITATTKRGKTATASVSVTGNSVAKHAIDLNRTLDGQDYWELGEYATADIYINGSRDADDVRDYWKEWPEGTRYEVRDVKVKSGYTFNGARNGNMSGTVGSSDVDIRLVFAKTSSSVAVTGIKLNKSTASVKAGSTVSLTATISPSNATNKSVTWSSSNTKVATVSGGTVKGVAAGTATITAKSNNGKTATCKVTVTKASTSVSYAAYNGVNYAKQTTNTKRIAALDKAKRMVTIKWTAPCDFVSWKSKGGTYNTVYDTSGKGAKKFVKNHTYTGVPYSMAGRDWDENGLKNALDKGIVTSSYMKKNWQGRTNTTAHGVDCSKFVYYALKSANTKTKLSSDLTTSTIPTCGAFTKVKGGFSSMKPGDVINKKGDHVRLYVGRNKKKYAFFESAGGASRCVYREYTEAELKGYTPYRFKGFGD